MQDSICFALFAFRASLPTRNRMLGNESELLFSVRSRASVNGIEFEWSLRTVDVDVLFFEPEIFKVLIEVLCGTFATKIYSLLHQGRCGPAVTWAID